MAQQKKEHWFAGLFGLAEVDVEAMYREGGGFTITGYGMLVIDSAVDEEKLFAAVKSICVKGKVSCSKAVKEHYGLK